MFALLCLLAPALALNWTLVNPITTIDDFVSASFGKDTIALFTKNKIFMAPAGSKSFEQVPYSINGTGYNLTWIDSCFYSNTSIFLAIAHYTSTAGQTTLMVTTSPDAKTWTISNQFTLQWEYPSIACGKNEVYMSTGVSVFQSIDGKTWKTRTPLVSFDRMVFLPALGYYVGWSHAIQSIFTSDTTREVWNIHVGPPKFPFLEIVQGQGVFVIAGHGVVYWSTNLAGFSVSNLPADSMFTFSALAYCQTLKAFVVTATNSTGLYVYQSTDGNIWTLHNSWRTDRTITKIIGANVVYAAGETGMVLFSKDSLNWELLSGNFWTTVQWLYYNPVDSLWYGPASQKDWYTDPTYPLYTTPDGVKWTRNDANASGCVDGFHHAPIPAKKSNVFLTFDSDYVYSSADLATWKPVFSGVYQNLRTLTGLYLDPSGSVFLLTASGYRVDELWTSTDDGVTWNRLPQQFDRFTLAFPVDQRTFVTVQGTNWFFVSKDAGATWVNTTTRAPGDPTEWLSNSKAVLHVGYNVTAASLSDLTTWTTARSNVSSSATWMVYQDTFYALERNKTFSSSDGVTWTMAGQPYYTERVRAWAPSPNAIFGVATDGVTVSGQ